MRKNNGIPRVVDLLDVDMNKVGDVNFGGGKDTIEKNKS